MLDRALDMLESKQLEENMKNLGALHVSYGVKEDYFPIMGEALIHTLKKIHAQDFNPAIKTSWMHVYDNMSRQMIQAMRETEKRGKAKR